MNRISIAVGACVLAFSATAGAQSADPRTRPVGLREVVRAALANNPDMAGARTDVDVARQSVLAEEGRYPYTFEADGSVSRTNTPRLGQNDTVTSNTTRSVIIGSTLSRTFPFGTVAELRVQGERYDTSSSGISTGTTGFPGAGYVATARASLTQPLLRGAGREVGEVQLRAARVSRAASEATRQRVESELIRDVASAYWELWYSRRALEIDRASLGLARAQEAQAKQRLDQGAISTADLASYQTATAQLEETVVSAEANLRQSSLSLSQLIGGVGAEPDTLVASSAPPEPGPPPGPASVETAIRKDSVELADLEQSIRLAETQAETAGDEMRPRLDLSGYLESNGVSSEFPHSWQRASSLGWWSAQVGLTFELPLEDKRKTAEREKARLAVLKARTNLRSARDRIASTAALAVTNARAARTRLDTAKRTLEIAKKQLGFQQQRFELGQAIPIEVQQARDSVRQAELRVARAQVDVVEAGIAIDHLMGRLVPQYSA